jgi:hypothetical protein
MYTVIPHLLLLILMVEYILLCYW